MASQEPLQVAVRLALQSGASLKKTEGSCPSLKCLGCRFCARLSWNDLVALSLFVDEFVNTKVVPWMEGRAKALDLSTSNCRKGLRNQLRYFWRRPRGSSSSSTSPSNLNPAAAAVEEDAAASPTTEIHSAIAGAPSASELCPPQQVLPFLWLGLWLSNKQQLTDYRRRLFSGGGRRRCWGRRSQGECFVFCCALRGEKKRKRNSNSGDSSASPGSEWRSQLQKRVCLDDGENLRLFSASCH